jgi:hypothetical protein
MDTPEWGRTRDGTKRSPSIARGSDALRLYRFGVGDNAVGSVQRAAFDTLRASPA